MQINKASVTTNPLIKEGQPLLTAGNVWGGTSVLSVPPKSRDVVRSFLNHVFTKAEAQQTVKVAANYGSTTPLALFGWFKMQYEGIKGGLAAYPVISPSPLRPIFNTAAPVNYNIRVLGPQVPGNGSPSTIQSGPTSYQPAQTATLGDLLRAGA